MRIKTAISYVRFAGLIALALIAAAVFSYIQGFTNYFYLGLFTVITLLALLVIFGRQFMIRQFMHRLRYPGVFYDVCDKLRLSGNMSTGVDETVMNDLYYSRAGTEEFLQDNKLSPYIYRSGVSQVMLSLICMGMIGLAFFVARQYKQGLDKNIPIIVWMLLALMTMLLPSILKRFMKASGDPVLIFSESGLQMENGLNISWALVYSWEVEISKDGSYIRLDLREELNGSRYVLISTGGYNVSYVDLLILLAHYANKYGYEEQVITEPISHPATPLSSSK